MEFDRAIELVASARFITVVGHLNPDADALGTALGLRALWRAAGKRCDAVFVSRPLPLPLAFLPGYETIKRTPHPQTDLIVAVDCGAWDRLGITRLPGVPVLVIDHHATNEGFGDVNLIDPDAPSASAVAYALAETARWPIGPEAATAFYTGLVSDTGFFGYEGVDGRVFKLAAALSEAGADPAEVARNLRERQPLSRLRLIALALATLRLHLQGCAASITITREMLARSGATAAESDDIVDYARSLATVEVGFLIREESDGRLKVSWRSKSYVDVAAIARAFGGGGHRRAAGATVAGETIESLKERILEQLEKELRCDDEIDDPTVR
jgi:phosphoesterase RecJ-like protein